MLCGVILRVGCQDYGPFKLLCILTSLDLLYGDMSALHCVYVDVCGCVREGACVRERDCWDMLERVLACAGACIFHP